MISLASLTLLILIALALSATLAKAATVPIGGGLVTMRSDEECWRLLPPAERGRGQPLPSWARLLAADLPGTTASLLQLDLAHRTKSPVDPQLRAAMRWVAARHNRCSYAQAEAAADAIRAGLDEAKLDALDRDGYPGWTVAEIAALEFARKMTVDSDSVTDEEFAGLVVAFGERQAAAMVLLLANANFQDRLLICLGLESEPGGPRPPLDVAFEPAAFARDPVAPPPLVKAPLPDPTGEDIIGHEPDWTAYSYDSLQGLIELQRHKPTRLPIPEWDEVARGLPEGLMKRPSDIIWNRICLGYVPELAIPFEFVLRMTGTEFASNWDRVFGSSFFWVTTRAMKCPYCMGHCEMNWEVTGLSKPEIAERSRFLAGDDWSSFAPTEQRAFAFTRTLTKTPWAVSGDDIEGLKRDFGRDRALALIFNACRYHYMTRISNGFQLRLENRNVFFDYYNVAPPTPTKAGLASREHSNA